MGFLDKFGFDGLAYCLEISKLGEDWSDSYFCTQALLDNRCKVKTTLQRLDIVRMQQYLARLDDHEKHFFTLAMKTLDH
jgi:hypothetical protein